MRFSDVTATSPVLSSRKQPVPYVDFAMPGMKQACPMRAACWSPAMPAIGSARPDARRLALIGDAERGKSLRSDARALNDLTHRRQRIAPDVLRVVLDPAGSGVVLLQLATRDGHCACLGIKHDGARRGGALVDGEDVLRCAHGVWPST